MFIDFRGKVISEHFADPNWDNNKFVCFLNKKGLAWDTIYWQIWKRLILLPCVICKQYFTGNEFNKCSYHPKNPYFSFCSNKGVFPCC